MDRIGAVVDPIERETIDRAARLAIVHLSLGILVIVMTPILFRLSELGPTATAFHRTFLAIPAFAVWAAIERRRAVRRGDPNEPRLRRDGIALVFGGVFFAGNIVAYAWALHFTVVANASLLSNLTPIFVALGNFLVFRERVSRGFVAAIVAAVAGVVILTGDRLTLNSDQIVGNGLALMSSLCFAFYLIGIGRLRLRVGAATIMLWSAAVASICLLLTCLALREALVPTTLYGWTIILALAFVSYALGQGLITVAMARLGASFSAVSLLILPVGAAILAWMIFGETLSINQGVGGVIILGSIYAARRSSR